jgi:V8-like Glu-specific endopeptidase
MKKNPNRFTSIILAVLFLTIFVVGVMSLNNSPVVASSGDSKTTTDEITEGKGVISSRGTDKELTVASQPWSKERMEAAIPYPLEPLDGKPDANIELAHSDDLPGLIPSKPPEGANITTNVEKEAAILSNTAPLNYTYPAPYTQYENFDSYKVFPYSTIGVLFFRQYGVDYRCSAASIGNFAIWTAGHCIHAGDNSESGWSYNVIFVPAYKNGNAPLGVWTADNHKLKTRTEWYASMDLRFDIAGAILNTNSSGESISQVVGNLGFAYNLPNNQHWFSFGYPAQSPFDGKTQEICTSSFAYSDGSFFAPPYPSGVGCNMTPGSSGGPWINQFGGPAGSSNYLNGNNSYRYISHPEEMFSPYFGNEAKVLLDGLLADAPLLGDNPLMEINLPIISK